MGNKRLLIAKIVSCVGLFMVWGCAGALGHPAATDPTERGLGYIAAAIVTHGILGAIFNK